MAGTSSTPTCTVCNPTRSYCGFVRFGFAIPGYLPRNHFLCLKHLILATQPARLCATEMALASYSRKAGMEDLQTMAKNSFHGFKRDGEAMKANATTLSRYAGKVP